MTTPRYQSGCAAGSEECREPSGSGCAFYVNLNNGNVNWNNRNNNGLAVACRRVSPHECQGVELRDLFVAYKKARHGKKPSRDKLGFDLWWMDGILELQAELNAGTWEPGKPICSIAKKPKAREIHAPPFRDRVVHHLAVPYLEAKWEPLFIHDSYSNRAGKGTHAAVCRVTDFVHQVEGGEGDGWFLKLDIHNCFNSINRRILYRLIKKVLDRHDVPMWLRQVLHAFLRRPPLSRGVIHRSSAAERALVPPHKRLENAAKDCGIPIGNLLSQFLVNIYMHELDLFVKHVLGAKRYARYVDDFILIHRDRAVLEGWKVQIEQFLADHLQLRLKDDVQLRPLKEGIDFLGYVIKPTRTTVRRRVVAHAREKLSLWERQHIAGGHATATPEQYRQLQATWASYGLGHFPHANAYRLTQDFYRRYPWLQSLTGMKRRFHPDLEDKNVTVNFCRAA